MTEQPWFERHEVTVAELRKFGLSVGAAFVAIFGLLLPILFSFAIPLWPFVLGGTLMLSGLAVPKALGPVHKGWMWFALKVGAFNSKVVLSLVFYVVFTPMGLLRRSFNRNPLGAVDPAAATYRKPSRHRTPKSIERPF